MENVLATMTWEQWKVLTPAQKESIRDYSALSPQLKGLEGYRVEVVTDYEETRRFIVGMSTGWRPCHLEISRRNSFGGGAAEQHGTVLQLRC